MRRFTSVLAVFVFACLPAVVAHTTAASAAQASTFKPDQDGFIQNWLVLDPIRLTGIQHTEQGIKSIVSRDSFKDLLTASPKASDSVSIDGTSVVWQAVSTRGYVVDLTGYAAKQNKPVLNVIFWGIAYITSPEQVKDVRLAIGSDDDSVWWVNGKETIAAYGVRQTATDDNVSKRLTLNKGINVVRFAVVQGDGPGDCCARFLDARQKPITNLSISLDPAAASGLPVPAFMQTQPPSTRGASAAQPSGTIKLADIRMRDVCILPDPNSKTYYMVGSGGRTVRQYTSKDLATWEGPRTIFTPPPDIWGDIRVNSIWAPELHAYKGRYYLFLTFDTANRFAEQWRNWRPRVTRGSTILGSDSPTGPFKAFQNHPTTPTDMMTLDGTLWVEDGVPYMVFAHEWVQITIGTIEYIQLKEDLSEAVTEPKRLFDAQDAPWAHKGREGCYVTDAPYLYKSRSGKLFMIWSSFGTGGYTTGVAVSDSGKLAGPWVQRPEPLYSKDGGHGMLFTTFDGKLMLVLHSPNGAAARPRIFEIEDTGETLRVIGEFTGQGST